MSASIHLEEIPYSPDSCQLYERLRGLPGAAFLDSSHPHSSGGRYDILVAQPLEVEIPRLPPGPDERAARAFFSELRACHKSLYEGIKPASQDLPFCGGLLGYLDYGCGNALHSVPGPGGNDHAPCAQLQAYEWCLVQDHLLHRCVFVSLPSVSAARRRELLARLRGAGARRGSNFRLRDNFTANHDEDAYRQAFEQVQSYIHAGDCYQVNLAQRFSATFEGDPWGAYQLLRAEAAAPFSAYLEQPGGAVLCLSPERFVSLHGHRVETSPIKGTRPRYRDPRADELSAQALRDSDKDRAENLMIVDLLRNDLGRSCVPGSIHVDRLFELQSFPTVHHLVSTISGELQPGRSAWELLRDSFPGGSITGAPKRRAMEIIAELEPVERQIYCGSVCYISADGRMDSNIAIRTLLCEGNQVHCWGGGGIVADSQWQQEYQETYDKVGRLMAALEEMD